MIALDQPQVAVRRLLKRLRRPYLLAREPLAVHLRETLQTESCREAVLLLIDRTFADQVAARLREILVRCDVQGLTTRSAAASMHLSLRQLFRCRAEAIDALALAIDQLDKGQRPDEPPPHTLHCPNCRQTIFVQSVDEERTRLQLRSRE